MRLHPYHTERVLSRSPFLSALASVAGAHHERLDGSGYHRGAARRSSRSGPCAGRSRRLSGDDRAASLPRAAVGEAGDGRARPGGERRTVRCRCCDLGDRGGGAAAPRLNRPAGLTEREAEVAAMLLRGLQTKQVAQALGISVKTADHHIQSAYRKIGVSTRAGATLFAMEHGLVAWGA